MSLLEILYHGKKEEMDRRNLYAGDLQIDYFSESYSHFEEDFQSYSNMSVPLTFLTDDIL